MANLRFGKRNRAWVDEHPNLAVAIANLRGQKGMSEQSIVLTLRTQLKAPPSYGDVRAAFARYRAGHRTLAGERGRALLFREGSPEIEPRGSQYRVALAVNREFDGGRRGPFTERLDKQHAVSAFIAADLPPEELLKEKEFIEWEQRVQETGGYQDTPPY